MTKWKVVAVEPEKAPYEKEMSFEEIQKFVGGYIQSVTLYDNKVALVNEEAEMKRLGHNRHVILQDKGHTPLVILGNFVVSQSESSDFVDLSDKDIEEAKFIFRSTSLDATIFI